MSIPCSTSDTDVHIPCHAIPILLLGDAPPFLLETTAEPCRVVSYGHSMIPEHWITDVPKNPMFQRPGSGIAVLLLHGITFNP